MHYMKRKLYLRQICANKYWVNVLKQTHKVIKQWYGKRLLKNFYCCQQQFRYRRRAYETNKHAETIRYGTSKVIPKKPFVSEEENNCKKEINLTSKDKIGNIHWCKNGCEFKLMVKFAKSFWSLLRLKSRSAREASKVTSFCFWC